MGVMVVAPFLISQCYNKIYMHSWEFAVVAPFLISQCYNIYKKGHAWS